MKQILQLKSLFKMKNKYTFWLILLAVLSSRFAFSQTNPTNMVGAWQQKDTVGGKVVQFRNSSTSLGVTKIVTPATLRDSLKNYLSNKNFYINVKDFGAKGDGLTNDLTAIQNAINAGQGKTVFFPKGSYKINGSINLLSGVNLLGEGDVGSGSGSAISPLGPDSTFAAFTNTSGVLEDVIIDKIRVIGTRYGISVNVSSGYVTKLKIYNSVFQDNYIAINVFGSAFNGMYANIIQNSYFKNVGLGVYCQGYFTINNIQNNGFENMIDGFIKLDGSAVSSNFTGNRCETAENLSSKAFDFNSSVYGFAIDKNYFENTFTNILQTDSAVNVSFTNNTCANSDFTPFKILINGGTVVINNNIGLTNFLLNVTEGGFVSSLIGNTLLDYNFSENPLLTQASFGIVGNSYNRIFDNPLNGGENLNSVVFRNKNIFLDTEPEAIVINHDAFIAGNQSFAEIKWFDNVAQTGSIGVRTNSTGVKYLGLGSVVDNQIVMTQLGRIGVGTTEPLAGFDLRSDLRITGLPLGDSNLDSLVTIDNNIIRKVPLDATLTALASYNTNGILTQTAADTFTGRTITGTTDQVNVTNGNGVSGNPTLSLPQSIATTSSPQFARLGLGLAASSNHYLTTAANTSTIGSWLWTPSSTDYTGTVSGTFYNNANELKFYDGTISATNRLVKLRNNQSLAGAGSVGLISNNAGDVGTVPIADRLTAGEVQTSANRTLTLTDFGSNGTLTVYCTTSGGDVTITLPSVTDMRYLEVTIIKVTAGNNVIISGSANINGSASISESAIYKSYTLVSNGTQYYIKGERP